MKKAKNNGCNCNSVTPPANNAKESYMPACEREEGIDCNSEMMDRILENDCGCCCEYAEDYSALNAVSEEVNDDFDLVGGKAFKQSFKKEAAKYDRDESAADELELAADQMFDNGTPEYFSTCEYQMVSQESGVTGEDDLFDYQQS